MQNHHHHQNCQHGSQHHQEAHHHEHGHEHGHQHHHNHEHHHPVKMQGSDQKWQQRHPNYASIDSGPQTFFYTLTNMLKLNQAKNILQVGCGAGKLLSTVLDLKNPNATYYATDLSQAMVKQAKKRLQLHFKKYQSKITFQQWINKQNIKFQVQNGEDIITKENVLFDRIVSNMVLCHANDPQKMLKNWNSVATQDCLLGISLLGDPQKNKLVRGMRESLVQAGEKLPPGNPPYYWYDKISKIVQASGWQIILQWQQNALFPYLTFEQFTLKPMGHKLSGTANQIFMKKVHHQMVQQKCGIQFWCKQIIARKKKN